MKKTLIRLTMAALLSLVLVDFFDQGQSERMTESYDHSIQVALLDAVLEDKLNDQAMLILDLREKWDSVIGPPLNKFIRLVNVKDSTVIVEVSHPAFLMELRKKSTSENCLKRILERYPQLQADSIMFVPAGQSA